MRNKPNLRNFCGLGFIFYEKKENNKSWKLEGGPFDSAQGPIAGKEEKLEAGSSKLEGRKAGSSKEEKLEARRKKSWKLEGRKARRGNKACSVKLFFLKRYTVILLH